MANPPLVFKTAATGWVYDGTAGTITQITDPDYPSNLADGSPLTVSSITRSSTVATVTTSTAHGYTNGRTVSISGANQAEYNVTVPITYIDTTTFSYEVSGSPASPATGTISSQLRQQTVPGIVSIDGTYYVMAPDGTIYGSDLEEPLVWNSLNYINAEVEFDGGVAIAKCLNYLVALGTWSTEVFYTNPNNAAPGSPLSRAENAYQPVGCATAGSVAQGDATLVWMSQAKEGQSGASAGRKIVSMSGFQSKVISTPFVERLLNADSLTEVRSCIFGVGGHSFYKLTLAGIAITLIYDFTTDLWFLWTSEEGQTAKSVVSLTSDGVQATAYVVAHGSSDGDVVTIAGADQTAYNGAQNITYIDVDHFSYSVAGAPASPATGVITATGYLETYVPWAFHAVVGNANLFLDKSSGMIYQLSNGAYTDVGGYINFLTRTPNIDLKSGDYKPITKLELIADKVVGTALVRYSKDDYQTHSNYRRVTLGTRRSRLSRIGRATRASFDVRVTDAIPVRIERMDVLFEGDE